MLGYAAAVLVLLAFSLRSMTAPRAVAVAVAGNLMFVTYAMGARLSPVFARHAALLPVNLWQLWQRPRCESGRPTPPA